MNTPESHGRDTAQNPSTKHVTHGRTKWVFIGFLALAAGLLIAEHRAHLLGALPWLIVLACPLMHLFMHRGHSHGGHDHHERERK
ncbi:MAG: DUF2933 domain-containing protein [Pseudazoarcus pumilus]|nr:DUF2933 domain-containing protein [Pseudazoarcus pumilus]